MSHEMNEQINEEVNEDKFKVTTKVDELKDILESMDSRIDQLEIKIATKLDNPQILKQFLSETDDWRTHLINNAHVAGLIDKSEKEELKKWIEENPLSNEEG